MTEQNQKKMYDNFVKLGLTKKAEAITNIQRYAHFKKEVTKSKEKK